MMRLFVIVAELTGMIGFVGSRRVDSTLAMPVVQRNVDDISC